MQKTTRFHKPLPSTRIVTFAEPTTPAPEQEKRELYTVFSGRQLCELGHLFESANLAQYNPKGEHRHENSSRGSYSMLHPTIPWININTTPSKALEDAWADFSGYGMCSLLIEPSRTGDGYSVTAKGPAPCPGYLAGIISAEDYHFIVNETTKPAEIVTA